MVFNIKGKRKKRRPAFVEKTVVKKAPKGMKPTRFRFKDRKRLGFRNDEVVEVVTFGVKKRV